MEWIFKDQFFQGPRLIDSILIMGITTKTLRKMMLDNETKTKPEIITQLPPSKKLSNHILKGVFNPYEIKLSTHQEFPSFYSTSFTHSNGKVEYLHCLMLYEKVSPMLLELSKECRNPPGFMRFVRNDKVKQTEDVEEVMYAPIVICLKTAAKYLDLFRNILGAVYSYLSSIDILKPCVRSCIVSVEFMKIAFFLLNDLIVPPVGMDFSFAIGNYFVNIPVEKENEIEYFENSLAILLDLVDVRNIVIVWEHILLGKSLVLLSVSDYTIYLVLQALISLIFPFKISQYCQPLVSLENLEEVLFNKPVIIGLNSQICSVAIIEAQDPEVSILNIDTNTLISATSPLLCDCQRCEIGQKLQYLKCHYYVNHERLNIYRMEALERSIKDQGFIKRVKKLTSEQILLKPEAFISLVRSIFVSIFFKNLHDYPNFLIYQSLSRVVEFQKDLVLQRIEKCQTCKLEVFWNELFASKSFKEFLEYSEKLDNSQLKKFNELCEGFRLGNQEVLEERYELRVKQKITTKDFFQKLGEFFEEYPKDNATSKFTAKTAVKLLAEVKSMSEEINFSQNMVKDSKDVLLETESSYFEGRELAVPNIFYGDFCIIQMLKGLINPISKEYFRAFTVQSHIFHLIQMSGDCPEAICALMLYQLRESESLWNVPVILELALKLEQLKPEILPRYFLAKIIEKELKTDKAGIGKVIENSKFLREIAEMLSRNPIDLMISEVVSEVPFAKKSSGKKSSRHSGRHSERKLTPSPDNSIG